MVASCGGYPKDICLYQAQKGLNLASQAVRKGGHILLLAASTQGVGDDVYFDYVSQFTSPEEVLADFKKQGFRMGRSQGLSVLAHPRSIRCGGQFGVGSVGTAEMPSALGRSVQGDR